MAALAGAGCLAFTAILYRLSGTSATTATVFRCAYALPVLLALTRYEDRVLGRRSTDRRRLCLLAGVLFAGDLVAWQDAIQHIGAGLATVVANMQVVILVILAWLLFKERPASRVLVGVVLLVIGMIGVSGVLEREAFGADPKRGVLTGIVAALLYAGYLLLMRQGNPDRRLAGPLLDASVAATAAGLVGGWFAGTLALRPSWPAHGWLALMALTSQVIGYGLVNLSLPQLSVVLTSILLMAQPVATLMLGAIILDEWPSRLQLLGTGFILLGILVASMVGETAETRRSSASSGRAAEARATMPLSGPPREV